MKRIILFTFYILPFAAIAQTDSKDMLTWSSKRLSWDDYKAKPDPTSDAAASTATVLSIDYSISNKSFSYKIKSYFSKARSWGLHKTDYILSHEQGHFDIAEIYARKLHKRMQEYVFNKRTYQKDLKKIYDDIADEKSAVQEEYDKETRHSINREKQAEWLKKIERLLNEYKDYADY